MSLWRRLHFMEALPCFDRRSFIVNREYVALNEQFPRASGKGGIYPHFSNQLSGLIQGAI
jgi:hypothetical protein